MIKDDPTLIEPTLKALKAAFRSGKTRDLAFRKQQLNNLHRGISENLEKLYAAISADLGYKNNNYAKIYHVAATLSGIEYTRDHLFEWAKERPVDTNLICGNATSKIVPEPFGTTLVIGAWNYALYTTVAPAVEAIAAGNTVCLKPSELSPQCSNVIKEIFAKYLDSSCYTVLEGGVAVASNICKHPWDLIIFTGSPLRGKQVALAAAENLVPCILELGGKSPTIVDVDANLQSAAMRITVGKFANCGQTCVAPDYIFVHESVEKEFTKILEKTIEDFYSKDPTQNVDYSKIVNEFHAKRLSQYIEENKSKVVYGGVVDTKEKYVGPTIISNPSKDSSLMKDEIFGPILPILKFKDIKEVVDYINDNPKPLALYYFGEKNYKTVELNTSSGGLAKNEVVFQILNHKLHFGGVGQSGQSSLHGLTGFNNCSHLKPVLMSDNYNGFPSSLRYPPYTDRNVSMFETAAKFGNVYKGQLLKNLALAVGVGFLLYATYSRLQKEKGEF